MTTPTSTGTTGTSTTSIVFTTPHLSLKFGHSDSCNTLVVCVQLVVVILVVNVAGTKGAITPVSVRHYQRRRNTERRR